MRLGDTAPPLAPPAYVSIRQHTSAHALSPRSMRLGDTAPPLAPPAYVSIRQHTSAYVSAYPIATKHAPRRYSTALCLMPYALCLIPYRALCVGGRGTPPATPRRGAADALCLMPYALYLIARFASEDEARLQRLHAEAQLP
jgi:hypothetical protein